MVAWSTLGELLFIGRSVRRQAKGWHRAVLGAWYRAVSVRRQLAHWAWRWAVCWAAVGRHRAARQRSALGRHGHVPGRVRDGTKEILF
eukprot:gene16696-biopygen23294